MFILNAVGILAMTMHSMAAAPQIKIYWDFIIKSINPPIAFMIIYFAFIFPQPRFSIKTTRVILLFMFVLVVSMALFFLFNKEAFFEIETSPYGPYILSSNLLTNLYVLLPYSLAFVICSLLWLKEYYRQDDTNIKKQLSILLIGFLFTPIIEALYMLWTIDKVQLHGVFRFLLPLYYLPLFLIIIPTTVYIVVTSIRRKVRGRSYDRTLLRGVIASYLFVILIIIWYKVQPENVNFNPFLIGFAFVRPLCFTYAVLKYQLFDIDIIIKRSTKIFMILAMIGLVFAGVQELIELILPFSRIISALIVAVAFIPIERLSEKITNRLFPWDEASDEYIQERRKDIYLAALEGAYYDAILTLDEEKMLARLRKQFEISEDEHLRYAHEAQKSVLPGALGTDEKGERTMIRRRKIILYAVSISILFILFVVGQELIENVLPMPTIVSAILLSLLFIPIKYLLDKYIIKRFKGEQKKTDARSQAIAVYESILRDAWEDRIITDMESDMLRFIRKELGISEEEHREMAGRIFV